MATTKKELMAAPTPDGADDGAARLARCEDALARIASFEFGSDERPGPATRAVAELKQIAREGLEK